METVPTRANVANTSLMVKKIKKINKLNKEQLKKVHFNGEPFLFDFVLRNYLTFSLFSLTSLAVNSSTDIAPRFSPFLLRTETVFSSFSFAPKMII